MSRDPRIDAYIDKSADFARPILSHVRDRVHAIVPEAEEVLKWRSPAFTLDGKLLLMMAAFKGHVALNFWRGEELRGSRSKDDGMGQFGRLTKLSDLPADSELDQLIARAAELARSPSAPRKTKTEKRPPVEMHPEFEAALAAAPVARKALDSFPPSARRDYLEWIASAKRDETRRQRIETAVGWLNEGKRRNWKYQDC